MERPSLSNTINSTLMPVLTAVMETSLNHLLYSEPVLRQARMRLVGKVLSIGLKEINTPFTLVFSEKQVDVLSQWTVSADCTVKTNFSALLKLRDRQQLSGLLHRGEIVIEGDMQVVQQWSVLLDMVEWDLAHYLSPYFGDIAAESISQVVKKGFQFVSGSITCQKNYLAETLTEEWKLAPNKLEVAYFSEEVSVLTDDIRQIEQRLAVLEEKYDSR
ncbi:SCP-2 sterol transfer family protein [Photorhabdus australis subsp. thailandensis]|uniref:Ubiquinone biosynthesis accessory factor UbiJ n=1 Tax=Photorhabdus australis subsp. thailandensis TaxID=2805096 RepID=A0A1C0U664_9GAMM|nr:SCP2 domain-containing protein [Photorhabdus australis]OCQ53430.1 SCP-2 sterol transfer family protein [Photorhabdus australis subsp. thailandensis]